MHKKSKYIISGVIFLMMVGLSNLSYAVAGGFFDPPPPPPPSPDPPKFVSCPSDKTIDISQTVTLTWTARSYVSGTRTAKFYVNGEYHSQKSWSTNAPFSFVYDPASAGYHTIKCEISDATGVKKYDFVSVTVKRAPRFRTSPPDATGINNRIHLGESLSLYWTPISYALRSSRSLQIKVNGIVDRIINDWESSQSISYTFSSNAEAFHVVQCVISDDFGSRTDSVTIEVIDPTIEITTSTNQAGFGEVGTYLIEWDVESMAVQTSRYARIYDEMGTTLRTFPDWASPTTLSYEVTPGLYTDFGTKCFTCEISDAFDDASSSVSVSLLRDFDRDGSPDLYDYDDDNDGLSDTDEISYGTNPYKIDTDEDGLGDNNEVTGNVAGGYITDPTKVDTDDDGLSDYEEIISIGTSPIDIDSDDDGMPDGWENANNLNPIVDDGDLDQDSDGLSNFKEFEYNSNPRMIDTDGDGLEDGEEVYLGLDGYISSPTNIDTDGDNIHDNNEIDLMTDPSNPFDPLGNHFETSEIGSTPINWEYNDIISAKIQEKGLNNPFLNKNPGNILEIFPEYSMGQLYQDFQSPYQIVSDSALTVSLDYAQSDIDTSLLIINFYGTMGSKWFDLKMNSTTFRLNFNEGVSKNFDINLLSNVIYNIKIILIEFEPDELKTEFVLFLDDMMIAHGLINNLNEHSISKAELIYADSTEGTTPGYLDNFYMGYLEIGTTINKKENIIKGQKYLGTLYASNNRFAEPYLQYQKIVDAKAKIEVSAGIPIDFPLGQWKNHKITGDIGSDLFLNELKIPIFKSSDDTSIEVKFPNDIVSAYQIDKICYLTQKVDYEYFELLIPNTNIRILEIPVAISPETTIIDTCTFEEWYDMTGLIAPDPAQNDNNEAVPDAVYHDSDGYKYGNAADTKTVVEIDTFDVLSIGVSIGCFKLGASFSITTLDLQIINSGVMLHFDAPGTISYKYTPVTDENSFLGITTYIVTDVVTNWD